MNGSEGQPRSLGEYIQGNPQQVIGFDSATGQGFSLVPSARVNDDAPITEDSRGVQSTPDASGGQGAPAAPGVTNPEQPQTQQGTPAQPVVPSPEMDELNRRLQAAEAENAQTRQLLVQQAQAAARAEQTRFMQSLEGLEPDEKQAKLLQFQNQQLLSANQALNQRLAHNEQASYATREQIAKTQVAHVLAQRNGLPADAVQVLMQAQDHVQMERSAAWLAQQFAAKQQAEQATARQQFMQGNAYKPTGDNAGAPVPDGPKKRSGDLAGLIGSRSYSMAPVSG